MFALLPHVQQLQAGCRVLVAVPQQTPTSPAALISPTVPLLVSMAASSDARQYEVCSWPSN